MTPKSTPKQRESKTRSLLKKEGIEDDVALLGVRGYYLDSMGAKNVNDRGIYDDAIFLIGPDCHVGFNANTDPSVFKPKVASLKAGVWRYKIGIHGLSKPKARQYQALVQADKVLVGRDGQADDYGWFGINIHRGGHTTTSSAGCQTIPPPQWDSFIALVKTQMKKHGQKTICYALIENNPIKNRG